MRFRFISKRSFPEENRFLQTITGVSEASTATVLTEIGSTVTDGHTAASWEERDS